MSSSFDELCEKMMKMAMLMTMQKMMDNLDNKSTAQAETRTYMTREEFLSLSDTEPIQNSSKQKQARPSITREEFLNLDTSEFDSGCSYTYKERAEESKLRKLGYSVANNSELSEVQRQSLLQNAIEHGLVSKAYVITYLENNIRINGKKDSNSVAVYKWKRDLEFVKKLK